MIYLDNAATTYPKSERVYQKLNQANRFLAVNAGRGGYDLAQQAAELIQDTRQKINVLFEGNAEWENIFTSSATFALNQILFGQSWNSGDVIYVSPYEHNSVMRPLYELQKRYDLVIKEMPLKPDCRIDLEKLEYQFAVENPVGVIITAVSNVTGYILPCEQIAAYAKQYEAIVIIDASQAAGLVPISVKKINADFIVWAGHKTLYASLGVGGYFARKKALEKLGNYFLGGTGSDSLNLAMPASAVERLEPASHNIVAIAGLHEALMELWEIKGNFQDSVDNLLQKEQELSHYLYQKLSGQKQIKLYPVKRQMEDYVGIVSFAINEYQAEDVGEILNDEFEIAVRTGYHCTPWIHQYLGSLETGGTVRVSLGRFNTKEDVDTLVKAVEEIITI